MKQLKVLELFAGTRSIGKEFDKKGHLVYSIELDRQHENIDWYGDINIITADEIIKRMGGLPDVIWASPPCEKFSVAAIGKHWIKGTNLPKTEDTKEALILLERTVNLIKELNPKYFFIENPRGKMRKMDCMQKFDRYTVTYCQYGDERMKPTDLWTNHPNPKFKPPCKNGDSCHVAAPRGSQTGTQGIKTYKDRSRIPEQLCKHISDICEEGFYPTNDNKKCESCPSHCRRCSDSNTCVLCENGYHGSKCESNENYKQEKLMKCDDGYFSDGEKCQECSENCLLCGADKCEICISSSVDDNGKCGEVSIIISTSSTSGEICTFNQTYSSESKCSSCSIYGDCDECSMDKCHECSTGLLTIDGKCEMIENCNITENGKCVRCNDGYYYDKSKCKEISNCKHTTNSGKCLECDEGYILRNNICVDESEINNCNRVVNSKCIECASGYYQEEEINQCVECKTRLNNCKECFNSSICLRCSEGSYLTNDGKCKELNA